jgi:hypothetical protein
MASVNWKRRNKVTHIWDQGCCGSCWAWATAGVLESSILIREHWNYDFSIPDHKQLCLNPKTLDDCCPSCYDRETWCQGGYPDKAFDYCMSEGLHQKNTTSGNWLPFHPPCGDMVYQMKDYYVLSNSDIDGIKNQVNSHPCLVVTGIYDDFYYYQEGVYEWDGVSDPKGLHAMVIVGYDDERQCFRIKNSWGTDWGHEGFCLMSYSHFVNDGLYTYALSPIQGSYSLSCKANGSHHITVSPSDNVNVVGRVISDHVSDPSNYYLMAVAPNGEVSYLEPSGQWTSTLTPYKVGEIENWSHTIHSGTLSIGTWRFYILLDHNVYHVETSTSRSKFCEIRVV